MFASIEPDLVCNASYNTEASLLVLGLRDGYAVASISPADSDLIPLAEASSVNIAVLAEIHDLGTINYAMPTDDGKAIVLSHSKDKGPDPWSISVIDHQQEKVIFSRPQSRQILKIAVHAELIAISSYHEVALIPRQGDARSRLFPTMENPLGLVSLAESSAHWVAAFPGMITGHVRVEAIHPEQFSLANIGDGSKTRYLDIPAFPNSSLYAISLSPSGKTLAVADQRTIRVISARTGAPLLELYSNLISILSLSWSQDERVIAVTGSRDGLFIKLFDLKSGESSKVPGQVGTFASDELHTSNNKQLIKKLDKITNIRNIKTGYNSTVKTSSQNIQNWYILNNYIPHIVFKHGVADVTQMTEIHRACIQISDQETKNPHMINDILYLETQIYKGDDLSLVSEKNSFLKIEDLVFRPKHNIDISEDSKNLNNAGSFLSSNLIHPSGILLIFDHSGEYTKFLPAMVQSSINNFECLLVPICLIYEKSDISKFSSFSYYEFDLLLSQVDTLCKSVEVDAKKLCNFYIHFDRVSNYISLKSLVTQELDKVTTSIRKKNASIKESKKILENYSTLCKKGINSLGIIENNVKKQMSKNLIFAESGQSDSGFVSESRNSSKDSCKTAISQMSNGEKENSLKDMELESTVNTQSDNKTESLNFPKEIDLINDVAVSRLSNSSYFRLSQKESLINKKEQNDTLEKNETSPNADKKESSTEIKKADDITNTDSDESNHQVSNISDEHVITKKSDSSPISTDKNLSQTKENRELSKTPKKKKKKKNTKTKSETKLDLSEDNNNSKLKSVKNESIGNMNLDQDKNSTDILDLESNTDKNNIISYDPLNIINSDLPESGLRTIQTDFEVSSNKDNQIIDETIIYTNPITEMLRNSNSQVENQLIPTEINTSELETIKSSDINRKINLTEVNQSENINHERQTVEKEDFTQINDSTKSSLDRNDSVVYKSISEAYIENKSSINSEIKITDIIDNKIQSKKNNNDIEYSTRLQEKNLHKTLDTNTKSVNGLTTITENLDISGTLSIESPLNDKELSQNQHIIKTQPKNKTVSNDTEDQESSVSGLYSTISFLNHDSASLLGAGKDYIKRAQDALETTKNASTSKYISWKSALYEALPESIKSVREFAEISLNPVSENSNHSLADVKFLPSISVSRASIHEKISKSNTQTFDDDLSSVCTSDTSRQHYCLPLLVYHPEGTFSCYWIQLNSRNTNNGIVRNTVEEVSSTVSKLGTDLLSKTGAAVLSIGNKVLNAVDGYTDNPIRVNNIVGKLERLGQEISTVGGTIDDKIRKNISSDKSLLGHIVSSIRNDDFSVELKWTTKILSQKNETTSTLDNWDLIDSFPGDNNVSYNKARISQQQFSTNSVSNQQSYINNPPKYNYNTNPSHIAEANLNSNSYQNQPNISDDIYYQRNNRISCSGLGQVSSSHLNQGGFQEYHNISSNSHMARASMNRNIEERDINRMSLNRNNECFEQCLNMPIIDSIPLYTNDQPMNQKLSSFNYYRQSPPKSHDINLNRHSQQFDFNCDRSQTYSYSPGSAEESYDLSPRFKNHIGSEKLFLNTRRSHISETGDALIEEEWSVV